MREHRPRIDAGHGRRVPRHVAIDRIGRWVHGSAAAPGGDVDQPIGVGDANRRTEQQGVRNGEYRDVAADANRERDRHGCGQCGSAAQHSTRIPRVPARIVDPGERSGVAVPIPNRGPIAQLKSGGATRRGDARSAPAKIVLHHPQVRRQLAFELAVGAGSAKQVGGATQDSQETGCHSDSLRSSLLTMPEKRRQRSVSSPSAAVPALVIV